MEGLGLWNEGGYHLRGLFERMVRRRRMGCPLEGLVLLLWGW